MANTRRNLNAASETAQRAERVQNHLTVMATKGTNAWLGTQADVLREFEGAMRGVLARRREAIEQAQRSLDELQSCRDMIEAMKVQQRWASDSIQRLASEIGEFGVMTLTLSQRALGGLWESGRAASEEANPAEFALDAAGAKPARRGRRPAA